MSATWTLDEADAFAAKAHAGQTRNTGDGTAEDVPYIVHPRAVRDILLHEHPNAALHEPWLLATALLHDVLEDCEVHPDELTAAFDSNVCAAVRALSKEMRMVEGATKTGDQYWSVLGNAPLAIRQIKAADRIDNLRSCLKWPRDRLARKYLVETPVKLLPLVVDDAWLYAELAGLLAQVRRMYP